MPKDPARMHIAIFWQYDGDSKIRDIHRRDNLGVEVKTREEAMVKLSQFADKICKGYTEKPKASFQASFDSITPELFSDGLSIGTIYFKGPIKKATDDQVQKPKVMPPPTLRKGGQYPSGFEFLHGKK